MILHGPPREPNDLDDVARRLGMILSPTQSVYRDARQGGATPAAARRLAQQGAASRAVAQTQVVLAFVRDNAVWSIPPSAFCR